MRDADGGKLEHRTQVEREARPAGMVPAGRVHEEDVRPLGQGPDGRLEQCSLTECEQSSRVAPARRPRHVCRGDERASTDEGGRRPARLAGSSRARGAAASEADEAAADERLADGSPAVRRQAPELLLARDQVLRRRRPGLHGGTILT